MEGEAWGWEKRAREGRGWDRSGGDGREGDRSVVESKKILKIDSGH